MTFQWMNAHNRLAFVGALIYGIAFVPPNFIYHIWIGFSVNLKYHFPILQIVIPLLLALIIFSKTWFRKKEKTAEHHHEP